MAETYTTLAGLAKLNDQNVNDNGISDLFNDAPFVSKLAATKASNGTMHRYLKETTAPVVGFRAVNVGRENSVSVDTQVDVTLALLDASFDVDQALANAYRGGVEAYIAREARRALKAAFFKFEQQLINGTNADAAGFSGLANATTLDALADVATVVNATGSTADTASSIYLVRTNADETDAMAVIGNDGEIKIGSTYGSTVALSTSTRFSSYHTPIMAYMGLQIGSAVSVVRIVNVTAQSGKTATDALISQGLALFPASRQPNLIVMGRRSRQQLQASRTATNATGAPAPIPTESFGIEIVTTDAITATEALIA